MQLNVQAHLNETLRHLYINPLEKCNLKCKICYTKKTAPTLTLTEITDFVTRYLAVQAVDTITFCGGEVFALSYFPQLLNDLTAQDIFVQVITNGTIDQLDTIKRQNSVNLIVSIDGTELLHDANRGEGTYQKSLKFLKKAHQLGFHTEIFSIIHQQNLHHIDEFEQVLTAELGFLPNITYHPRKPPTYLSAHPVANITGEVADFDFLTREQMLEVMKTRNVFPPPHLGCYQIAVTSSGKVYGCCEGTTPIGAITDTPVQLINQLKNRVETWSQTSHLKNCLGCSQPDFMCGIKSYLEALQ